FLVDAATSIIREVNSEENIRVEDLMMLAARLSPDLKLQRFIDEVLPSNRRLSFPVSSGGRLVGIFVLEDLHKVNASEWREREVGSVMRAVKNEHFIHTRNSASDARLLIETNGVH